jgi:molybdopterin-containing oxidoreductase family iron-sulfur binding subunit
MKEDRSEEQAVDMAIKSNPLTRRRFLGGVGAVAGVAAAGLIPLTQVSPKPASTHASMAKGGNRQWAFVIDLRRCDGCSKCTEGCQEAHSLPKEHEWIKVYETTDEDGVQHFMPRLCMQCENPPCLKVCPVGATFKNDEGVVLVDQSLCIGCRLCMAACPYEARYFNYEDPPKPKGVLDNPMPEFPVPQQKGTVGKCILCVHNTSVGKLPACVESCAMHALFIADLNADVMTNASGETYKLSKYLSENDAYRLKEELNTSPRVWYVAGHGQDLEF